VSMVIIRGNGKAFCAGGDIRALAQAALVKNAAVPRDFFGPEYVLVGKIFNYSKPYVALLDGITMGGGVGISIGSMFRVATEKLSFAMPETGIGFVTDVGASYFLTRLKGPNGVGLYLGLTGARLGAADALFTGVVTHFVNSAAIPELLTSLTSLNAPNSGTIENTIHKYTTSPGAPPLEKKTKLIEHCFGDAESVEDIIQRLESVQEAKYSFPDVAKDEAVEWAKNTLKTLKTRAPLSLKVVFELLKQGKRLDIRGALQLEYRIAMRLVIKTPTFYEGVRSVIIEKDNKPKWLPARLEDVEPTFVTSLFKKFDTEELRTLSVELYDL